MTDSGGTVAAEPVTTDTTYSDGNISATFAKT